MGVSDGDVTGRILLVMMSHSLTDASKLVFQMGAATHDARNYVISFYFVLFIFLFLFFYLFLGGVFPVTFPNGLTMSVTITGLHRAAVAQMVVLMILKADIRQYRSLSGTFGSILLVNIDEKSSHVIIFFPVSALAPELIFAEESTHGYFN